MPTNRTRRTRPQIGGGLTEGQRSRLETGFSLDLQPFASPEHERAAWLQHRAQIMASWSDIGARPRAFWTIEPYQLKRTSWPREWTWPHRAISESDAVHKLIVAGELHPLPNELELIEAAWLATIRKAPGIYAREHATEMLGRWSGVPPWFIRRHIAEAYAEHERALAEHAAAHREPEPAEMVH